MLSASVTSTTFRIYNNQLEFILSHSQRATYVDRAETGTVAGSHVLVQSLDGLGTAHLTELLVHVVGTGAGVVADPDTEVLDLKGALLVDLGRNQQSFQDPRINSTHTTFRLTISPLAFFSLRS